MMNKTNLIFLMMTVSSVSFSEEMANLVDVYLSFEKDYLEKNIASLSKRTDASYLITNTVFVEGKLFASRMQTKTEFLEGLIGSVDIVNESGSSSFEDIHISKKANGDFCGKSTVKYSVGLKNKKYKEAEIREICFKKYPDGFRATKHGLEYIYHRQDTSK